MCVLAVLRLMPRPVSRKFLALPLHHMRGGMWTAPHHTNTLENKGATRNDKQTTLRDKLRCPAYAPHQAAP